MYMYIYISSIGSLHNKARSSRLGLDVHHSQALFVLILCITHAQINITNGIIYMYISIINITIYLSII